MYLLLTLHICDVGGIHQRLGSLQCFYYALPLWWQSYKTTPSRIIRRVHPVLKVLGCRDLYLPLLLLFPLEHFKSLGETEINAAFHLRKNTTRLKTHTSLTLTIDNTLQLLRQRKKKISAKNNAAQVNTQFLNS